MKAKKLEIIGWREWVSLPELGIKKIKAKVDTGARTSSLHAYDIETIKEKDGEYLKFKVHPIQGDSRTSIKCKAKLVEYRNVKSSNGKSEKRPVVMTSVKLLDDIWNIEMTLTNRDEMGFRMLLGRASVKNKFLVNPGKSFYSKKDEKKKKIKS